MREWLDATVQRIVDLKPKRVLEIGCGTGMILYGVLPHVGHYTAVDLSPHALETIRRELSADENAKVTLLHQPAHALEGVAPRSCDVVVINSVAQYFPDAEYLARVLTRATELVADGGHIFVGDVRSLAHLSAFHTVVELHQASAFEKRDELKKRIERRIAQEGELLLDERFFAALSRDIPRLTAVSCDLKRGRAHNEMSTFRYDVVLHVGATAPALAELPQPQGGVHSIDAVRSALASAPAALLLTDIPNARLGGPIGAEQMLKGGTDVTAENLRELIERPNLAGIEPEDLYTLSDDYRVELRWASSGDPARFDALLRHKERGPKGRWQSTVEGAEGPATRHANRPAKVSDKDDLLSKLRAHLREVLPEYMVPSAFVVLDALPLTPNGKIDRKALPAPTRKEGPVSASYVAPTNELEQQIAEVWQEMLNVERVGLRDNIFDLGANSLLTVQANNRLSALLGKKVSLVSMFRFPTVESLAAHLGDGKQPVQAQKRVQERADRKADAAERRRQVRAERGTRGS
jgi:SAM-dependent methyltransferase